MKLTRKCFGCKQDFRKTELVEYCSLNSKTPQWYCTKCLEERQERDKFANKVCEIFGIKSPGPILWSNRKNIQNKYGYTDNIIVDCLDYIYKVKKMSKLSESLVLIRPSIVEEMRQWKRSQQGMASSIAAAIANTKTSEEKITIKENNTSNKELYENFDDLLNDD